MNIRGERMMILAACLTGFVCGWVSVVLALWLLRPKVLPMEQSRWPDTMPEETRDEKQHQDWLAQWQLLLDYDGKGGTDDGNQEDTGGNL